MYAKIINEETKQCDVGTGTNTEYYQFIGMTEMEVEQAYNGNWYVQGYAPSKPQSIINQERVAELKRLLQETDYIDNKLLEAYVRDDGTLDELKEKYKQELINRQAYRDEINSLEN